MLLNKTKENLTVTLDLDLIALLQDDSKAEHRTMSSYINKVLWLHYESNKKKGSKK